LNVSIAYELPPVPRIKEKQKVYTYDDYAVRKSRPADAGATFGDLCQEVLMALCESALGDEEETTTQTNPDENSNSLQNKNKKIPRLRKRFSPSQSVKNWTLEDPDTESDPEENVKHVSTVPSELPSSDEPQMPPKRTYSYYECYDLRRIDGEMMEQLELAVEESNNGDPTNLVDFIYRGYGMYIFRDYGANDDTMLLCHQYMVSPSYLLYS